MTFTLSAYTRVGPGHSGNFPARTQQRRRTRPRTVVYFAPIGLLEGGSCIKMADFKRTKEYKTLKKSLEENLDARGLCEPIYGDMVRRYLSYREMEYLAEQDIAEKGLNIWDAKRGSWQANPSIATKVNASRQAAAIYRALGFEDEAKKARGTEGDDDEL